MLFLMLTLYLLLFYVPLQTENSLWIGFLLLANSTTQVEGLLQNILTYAFAALPDIDHILLSAPSGSGFQSGLFAKLASKNKQNVGITFRLMGAPFCFYFIIFLMYVRYFFVHKE
jgi:hypothetical protein